MERIIDFNNYPNIISLIISSLNDEASYEIEYMDNGVLKKKSYISENVVFPFIIFSNYDKLLKSNIKVLSIKGNVYLYNDSIYKLLKEYASDNNESDEDDIDNITKEDFLPFLKGSKSYLYINSGDIRHVNYLSLEDTTFSRINLNGLTRLKNLTLSNIDVRLNPRRDDMSLISLEDTKTLTSLKLVNIGIYDDDLLYNNRDLINIHLENTNLKLENIFSQNTLSQNLKKLNLTSNSLENIPEELYEKKLPQLEYLILGYNEIDYIPEGMGNMTIKSLDLTSNRLASRDFEYTLEEDGEEKIIKLRDSHLENLWKNSYNSRLSIPNYKSGLTTSLTELGLADNSITSIDGITNLLNLEVLDISGNFLTHLPENIGDMIKLKVLICEDNQLNELPQSICDITSLTTLKIELNNITSLPRNMYKLSNLEVFTADESLLQKYVNIANLNISREGDIALSDLLNAIKTYPQNIFKKKIIFPLERKRIKKTGETGQKYKWQKGCINWNTMGNNLTNQELFQYVLESVLLLVDITDEVPKEIIDTDSKDEENIKIELEKKYNEKNNKRLNNKKSINNETYIRRLMCADLSLMLDIYRDYLVPLKDMCANELISGDEIEDVPFGQMLTFKEDDKLYCLTIDDLTRMKNEGNILNPYTRSPIPDIVFETLEKRKKFLDWIDTIEIMDEDRIHYDILWNKISRLYPIGEMDYKKIPDTEIRNMYNVLMNNTDDVILPLVGEDIHLALVKVFNSFIGDLGSSGFTERAALVNQIMKGEYDIDT